MGTSIDPLQEFFTELTNRTSAWKQDAACHGMGDTFFFDRYETGVNRRKLATARLVCRSCPVRRECLKFAIDNRIKFGVWGGKTRLERQEIVRARRRKGRVV